MPLSTDVSLPREHVARYPERCVRCGMDNEGNYLRIWTHTLGWWTYLFWAFGKGFTTSPPVCRDCVWRVRLQRNGGFILIIINAVAVMFFIWPRLNEIVIAELRKWVAMGLILLCSTPYFLWEVIFPPPIDITAYKDSVDYEFADARYAEDFADLNNDADWIEIS